MKITFVKQNFFVYLINILFLEFEEKNNNCSFIRLPIPDPTNRRKILILTKLNVWKKYLKIVKTPSCFVLSQTFPTNIVLNDPFLLP
jgi:hypothetical protein